MKRFVIAGLIITSHAFPNVLVAQRSCEKSLAETWEITIAGEDEPGQRFIVEGTVTDQNGAPVSGATVYVYHTDIGGYYAPKGEDQSVARLCGLMLTGERGRYRFHTIKPASYPHSRIAAHIHYVVSGSNVETGRFDLEFTDDPFVSERRIERDIASHEGLPASYRGIQSLEKNDDGVLKCTRDLRVTTH